jgi:hypothetical protein
MFTSNGIAYAADLGKFGESLKATLALIADPKDPRSWAKAWLAQRYTDRLTIKDTFELLGAIRDKLYEAEKGLAFRESRAVCTGTSYSSLLHSQGTYTLRGRLRCALESRNSLMTSIKKLMDWDVWPTLENTWDLIPLSFVVDWFLNISSILKNIDLMVYEQYLKVETFELSEKVTYPLDVDSLLPGFSGDLVAARYSRQYRSTIPEVRVLDGWSPSLPSPKNFVDGAALLVCMR